MNAKPIISWRATAAINSDGAELALQYADGGQEVFKNLTPARLATLIAVLESSQSTAVIFDTQGQP